MTEHPTILAFLRSHAMATIATVNTETLRPESALIAFAELDNLELIFETFSDSRKYTNLLQSSYVALVIGGDATHHITLQYEGIANAVSDDNLAYYRSIFLRKDTPCTEQFLLNPRARLFHVQPRWLRLSDYTSSEPKITELTF